MLAVSRVPMLVAVAATATLAALLIALGAFNWPAADDFCNKALVQTRGVGGALHWFYFEWSGRLATGIVAFTLFSLLSIPALRIVSMLLAAALVVIAWQISAFVYPRSARERWPLIAFVLAALTLGLYPLLAQTVFWPSGGIVYIWPLMLLLYWLLAMRALLREGKEPPGNVYWFVLSAILGNSIELVLPIVACYVGVMMFGRWRTVSSPVRRAVVVRTIGIAAGAALLIAAPGNYLRANATPDPFRFDPQYLIAQYGTMLESSASAGAVLLEIAVGLLVLALLAKLPTRRQDGDCNASARRFKRDEMIALLAGAALSIVPVLAAPAQFAPRNALYGLVCVLIAALLPLEWWINGHNSARIAATALAVLAGVGTLLAAHTLIADLRLAEARLPAQLARDRLLSDTAAAGGKEASVVPISAPPPATMHAVDMSSDAKNLLNWCVATYYHLDSVVLETAPRQ